MHLLTRRNRRLGATEARGPDTAYRIPPRARPRVHHIQISRVSVTRPDVPLLLADQPSVTPRPSTTPTPRHWAKRTHAPSPFHTRHAPSTRPRSPPYSLLARGGSESLAARNEACACYASTTPLVRADAAQEAQSMEDRCCRSPTLTVDVIIRRCVNRCCSASARGCAGPSGESSSAQGWTSRPRSSFQLCCCV